MCGVQTFEVTLVNGVGGASIGEPSSVLVTILSNDDINGVFSFTETSLLVSDLLATISSIICKKFIKTSKFFTIWAFSCSS